MKPIEFYKHQLESIQAKLAATKKHIRRNTNLRLASFLSALGFLFALSQWNMTLGITLSVLSFAVFGWLIKQHVKLTSLKNYQLSLENELKKELDACSYIFSSFRNGSAYKNPGHHFTHDLDIFGEGSIFQMINRTVTESGESKLANMLATENLNPDSILQHQEAIKELGQMPEFLLKFRTVGGLSELASEDKKELETWLAQPSFVVTNKFLNVARYLLPAIFLGSILLTALSVTNYSLVILLFIFNLSFVGFFLKKVNSAHNKVSSFLKVFSKYQQLIAVFDGVKLESDINASLNKALTDRQKSASTALKSITKYVSAFDNRLNVFASIFLQGFFLYDLHCVGSIEKWKNSFKNDLPLWIDHIAQFDALISLGTYTYNNPGFCYPTINSENIIKTEGIGHPFIPESVRVCNDFAIRKKGSFVIVTGANMAGKSTFLRTIGLNLVLAMTGVPICAKTFAFKPTKLYSSMRTTDSLNENESYFYAELKRLKELTNLLEADIELFILLDEILKGTNSVDKQKGSQLALEKILRLKGTGIIATHDLALTEIESKYPDKINNQCFEIDIDRAKIKFDYKLKNGVTQNMNAMLLMEQMGII